MYSEKPEGKRIRLDLGYFLGQIKHSQPTQLSKPYLFLFHWSRNKKKLPEIKGGDVCSVLS